MTDPDEKSDSKKSRDWKGMAAMVGAVLAVLGFAWNKVDALYDREESSGVQKASYEILAARVNAMCARLELMERRTSRRGRRRAKGDKEDAETMADMVVRKLKVLLNGEAAEKARPAQPEPVAGAISADAVRFMEFHEASEVVEEDEPVEAYEKLPSFQAVQKRAGVPEGE